MPTNVQGMTIVRAIALAALGFLAQACVTSPYNGQLVTDPSAPVTIAGFFNQPNVTLTIEAANPSTGAWEILGTTTTSASTPTIAAGTWKNSPPLYFYSTTVQVYDPAKPQTFQRWGGSPNGVATLRVRSEDSPLYTGHKNSVSCVTQNASQTEDFYTTAYNCGYQQTTIWIHYIDFTQVLHDFVLVSPEKFSSNLQLALLGTRFQISQTDEGVPLTVPGSATMAMSYVDFNDSLNKAGVSDLVFDVPIVQQGIGNLAMGVIGALSGGTVTAYEVRFKVNNLHSVVGLDTFKATLEDGAFVFDLALSSGNPTIKCEANTLSFLPFGFPIPVGWQDNMCPDAQFRNAHLRLRFVPGVDAGGKITINDATVTLDTEIDVSPIDFLEEHLQFKQKIKEAFESQLREKLLSADFKSGLGTALTKLFEAERGKPITTVFSISVDSTGILIEVP